MKMVVLSSRYANGTNKKGKAYNGFFVGMVRPENGTNGFKSVETFISVEVLKGVVPEPGMVFNVETDFGSTFINEATPVVDDGGAFLSAFLAPFQQQLSKSGK